MKLNSSCKYRITLFVVMVTLALVGCQTIPKDALKLTPKSLEKRRLQTRIYEGILEVDILAASAGVIQDLGFNIDESETADAFSDLFDTMIDDSLNLFDKKKSKRRRTVDCVESF